MGNITWLQWHHPLQSLLSYCYSYFSFLQCCLAKNDTFATSLIFYLPLKWQRNKALHTRPTFSFFITSYILSGHHRRADVEFEFITQLCLDSAIIGDKLNQSTPHTRLSHSQNRIWMKCSLKMPLTLSLWK